MNTVGTIVIGKSVSASFGHTFFRESIENILSAPLVTEVFAKMIHLQESHSFGAGFVFTALGLDGLPGIVD
jgi:hypothetical protein